MRSDEDIKRDFEAEFTWGRDLGDALDVAVAVKEAGVTLTGFAHASTDGYGAEKWLLLWRTRVSDTRESEIIETVPVREVVGTVSNLRLLESMASELTSAGFDKSDIDLMASPEAVRAKLGAVYAEPIQIAEVPDLPRRKLVTPDEKATITGVVFGTLVAFGALGAGLPVLASGGALAAAIAASAGGGLAGAAIAKTLRKILTKDADPDSLERDLRAGGLVIFVRVRNEECERKAQAIMRKHGAVNVHVHEIELRKVLDELPLAKIQPDPWLAE